MKRFLSGVTILLFLFCLSTRIFAGPVESRRLSVGCSLWLSLQIRIYRPEGEPRGDILYLHGFADRSDNHGPLFDAWVQAGYRVIAFDLPSHGETKGLASLDFFSLRSLGKLALAVEAETREDASRPLILAGWSTGGLLGVRMLQTNQFTGLPRVPSALVLFAPGIAVRTLIGEWGFVTERSLTRNPHPPHRGPISPKTPFLRPFFATGLLVNSWLAETGGLPEGLPLFIAVGGEDTDVYVKSRRVLEWGDRIKQGRFYCANQFGGCFHELDNEPGADGASVRKLSTDFLDLVFKQP